MDFQRHVLSLPANQFSLLRLSTVCGGLMVRTHTNQRFKLRRPHQEMLANQFLLDSLSALLALSETHDSRHDHSYDSERDPDSYFRTLEVLCRKGGAI